MRWLSCFNNLPVVHFKETSVFRKNLADWIVKNYTLSERDERAVNMNRVWITWEIHRMYPRVREMALNPIDSR